jgi:hypothetical protein
MAINDVLGCLPTLKRLAKANTVKERRVILANAKNCVYKAICEIVHNVLLGNIPISCYRKKQLYKHREKLRLLTKPRLSLEKRKEIIQKGGFLQALLVPAISILTEIVAKKLLK